MLKYDTTDLAGEFCYVEFGDKDAPSLVLLHGWGADLGTWAYVILSLSKIYHVLALDLPGHGRSSAQIGEATSEFLVQWLRQVGDKLGISRFHLLGHSMGGQVAAEYALTFPDSVESLVLLAPAGVGFPANLDAVELSTTTKSLGAPACPGRTEAQSRLLANSRIGPFDFPWHSLACPLKLIWGADDRIVPPPSVHQVPGICNLSMLGGVGHAPQQEAPVQMLALIQCFVSLAGSRMNSLKNPG